MSKTNFSIANNIAFWASVLDDSKDDYPIAIRARAFACAEEMHAVAKFLAGDRVGEIYDMTEGEML